MTPTRRLRVAMTAARAPGSMTPITGTSKARWASASPAAVAVLQATTMSLTGRAAEPRADLEHEPPHLVAVARTVGAARGVAEVDERLARQYARRSRARP